MRTRVSRPVTSQSWISRAIRRSRRRGSGTGFPNVDGVRFIFFIVLAVPKVNEMEAMSLIKSTGSDILLVDRQPQPSRTALHGERQQGGPDSLSLTPREH